MHARTLFVTTLLALAAAAAAQQSPSPSSERASAPSAPTRRLSLRFAEFDPAQGGPTIPDSLQAQPRDGADYFLVQLPGVTDEGNKQALQARGLELMDYVPADAWIVRGTAAQVAQCAADGVVVWSQPLHPAFRIEPELLVGAGDERRVVVVGFAGIAPATLREQIAAVGGVVLEEHEQIGRWLVVVSANRALVEAIAHCRDVQWIEPESIVTERNDNMTWAVQTNSNGNRRLWTLGLHGENQVIGHQDGAIATASCFFSDPVNPIGPLHRKIVYRSGSTTANSHGTHTAGICAGDQQPVNGSTAGRGLAYAAKIAHSADYSATVWAARATTHRGVGARVFTNSWGNDGTTAYNSHCNAIDAYQWTNEDDLVFFAETNLSTLKNPENAKNLVAVGNAQNGASYANKGGGGTGPTADGRRKPDLFAPGSAIVSASTASCGTASLTGTSMACPSATAAAALIRQYFLDGFYPNGANGTGTPITPTGALMKAVLVNSCEDMTGVAGTVPNNTEGWGHIVLDRSLYFSGDAGRLWVADVRRAGGLTTGQQREFLVTVGGAATPLEVTMAFTDFAGTTNAANPVVNDLNLVVIAPNGTQYLGNVWTSGASSVGGTADAINNLERVRIAAPAAGTWTFRVVGATVPQGPCGFALAANGNITGGFTVASVANYGAGKPGILGVPAITGNAPVIPSTWTLSGTLTVPNAFAIVVFGSSQAAIPFDGGTVLATPEILDVVVTGAGLGPWSYPVTIPASAALNGVSTFWQFWMPNDASASGDHWAASTGLQMTMGN
ncbi:MAG: S8 family serine peptidase [Planctomycetes bacterium]|nr:S8 family serine peptidase [Planctomycetota bacterium]